MSDFIYISHLPWHTVQTQPFQFPWRFMGRRRVLFVEEPVVVTDETQPRLDIERVHNAAFSALTVVRLLYPMPEPHDIGHGHTEAQPVYSSLLVEYLQAEKYRNPILWLCTPMGLEFIDVIDHGLLVYDTLNRQKSFRQADVELNNREITLLQEARLVIRRRSTKAVSAAG